MSEQTATGLIGAVDTLTTKLEVAEKVTRRLRWVTRGLVVVVVFLGYVVLQQHEQGQDIEDQAVTSCESGNLRLAGQRDIWHAYFEVATAGAIAQGSPQAVLDYYVAFERWIKTDVLPDRDCANLDEPIAEPGKPPSFEKALEGALRDQQAKTD